jgi:hypothetical protein
MAEALSFLLMRAKAIRQIIIERKEPIGAAQPIGKSVSEKFFDAR